MSQNLRVPRPVRRLDVRVFQHATENRDRVLAALRFVTASDKCRESRAEGYHGNPIIIFETELGSRKEIEQFWARVREAGIFPGLEENLEERVNDEGELFIRFEKQNAVEWRLVLSAGDDVIAARARVFEQVGGMEKRADRSAAIRVMREFLRAGTEEGLQAGTGGQQATGSRRQGTGEGGRETGEDEDGALGKAEQGRPSEETPQKGGSER